jgi:hypothetical protein
VGTGVVLVVVATVAVLARASTVVAVLAEAAGSITVIPGVSVPSAAMTTTPGAGGVHAITDGSATDDYATASQGRSHHCLTATPPRDLADALQNEFFWHIGAYQAGVRNCERS